MAEPTTTQTITPVELLRALEQARTKTLALRLMSDRIDGLDSELDRVFAGVLGYIEVAREDVGKALAMARISERLHQESTGLKAAGPTTAGEGELDLAVGSAARFRYGLEGGRIVERPRLGREDGLRLLRDGLGDLLRPDTSLLCGMMLGLSEGTVASPKLAFGDCERDAVGIVGMVLTAVNAAREAVRDVLLAPTTTTTATATRPLAEPTIPARDRLPVALRAMRIQLAELGLCVRPVVEQFGAGHLGDRPALFGTWVMHLAQELQRGSRAVVSALTCLGSDDDEDVVEAWAEDPLGETADAEERITHIYGEVHALLEADVAVHLRAIAELAPEEATDDVALVARISEVVAALANARANASHARQAIVGRPSAD